MAGFEKIKPIDHRKVDPKSNNAIWLRPNFPVTVVGDNDHVSSAMRLTGALLSPSLVLRMSGHQRNGRQ